MEQQLKFEMVVTGQQKDFLANSLFILEKAIEDNHYKGYDPYDGLSSPLFTAPVLKSNKKIRFYCQQLIKRFPFNLRDLLAIPQGVNPVTLGLCIQGYSYRIKEGKDIASYKKKIASLISSLEQLIPAGYSGACWGYNFDWEARYASIPAYQPTVVATGIISNALYIAHKVTGNARAGELVASAADFILKDLNEYIVTDNSICFSYSPFDHQKVLNASMKAGRTLSQAFDLTGEERYRQMAANVVRFAINHQNDDGSWPYSISKKGKWIDNYHTGYVLDCMDEYIKLCKDDSAMDVYYKGLDYYVRNFITDQNIPKLYNNKIFPVDCTSASQCILTLVRNNELETASSIAQYMIKTMQMPSGRFMYRNYNGFKNKIPFMRWSDAWMYAALSNLLLNFDLE